MGMKSIVGVALASSVVALVVWVHGIVRDKAVLEERVAVMCAEIDSYAERAHKLSVAVSKLQEDDDARRRQQVDFERKLRSLRADSAEVRRVLDIVIPDNVIDGLRIFANRGNMHK